MPISILHSFSSPERILRFQKNAAEGPGPRQPRQHRGRRPGVRCDRDAHRVPIPLALCAQHSHRCCPSCRAAQRYAASTTPESALTRARRARRHQRMCRTGHRRSDAPGLQRSVAEPRHGICDASIALADVGPTVASGAALGISFRNPGQRAVHEVNGLQGWKQRPVSRTGRSGKAKAVLGVARGAPEGARPRVPGPNPPRRRAPAPTVCIPHPAGRAAGRAAEATDTCHAVHAVCLHGASPRPRGPAASGGHQRELRLQFCPHVPCAEGLAGESSAGVRVAYYCA